MNVRFFSSLLTFGNRLFLVEGGYKHQVPDLGKRWANSGNRKKNQV
jgi:hypothetical protein